MSKVAVIAGVGAGLGASLVRKFARQGCKVGMLARFADYMQVLATELEQEGLTALSLPTDITDPEKVKVAFAQVRQQLGPVDILINHAGNAV
jgi:NADP-dependent 3-hydroxy acid dehydrogenase YdfG